EKMDENGLIPIVLAKCKTDYLTNNGISGIATAIYDLRNKITLKYPNLSPFAFVSSYERLLISYYQSTWLFVLFIPIIIGGYLQSIIISDIILKERKKDLLLLRDRGAQIPQILSLLIIEFSILSIIAILISLGLSFLLASVIPLVASGTYSVSYYSFILSTMSFPTVGFFLSSLGTIIVISLFVFLKNKHELNQFITERERFRRKKLLTVVMVIVPIVIFTGLLISILVLIIPYLKEISITYNYNLEQIKTSSIILALLLVLFFIFIVLFTFGFSKILGRFKSIYKLIFPKNYFFLLHNFKKINNNSSVLLILTILFSSSVIYSNLLVSSLNENESETEYYNNGSDLRIETIDSRYQYYNNISNIEGVREAIPIFKLSGLLGYSSVTLYGVNPLRYSRLGRWDKSSFNENLIPDNMKEYNITQWFQRLETQKYGIFISDALAEKHGYSIGSHIRIRNIENPSSYSEFTFIVVGIIHSAPGLGLASGKNFGLGQYNDEFVIIHEHRMVLDFQLKNVNLFFANSEKNASINKISSEIYQFNNVSKINPKLISEGETAEYIQKYVPKIQLFINVEYTLMAIIGLVLIFTFNNFILMNRRSTNAILFAFGNSFKNFLKSLMAEYSVIIITTLIFSILFGFLLTTLILTVNAPFLKSMIIIPLALKSNVKGTILIPIIITLVILTSLLPLITSTKKAKLVNYL
ncbi:MAG: hypothetical protein EAX90_15850, partial [Candidatus Heimdallarchaeota archaeon]|nr:hypothetical protein [Candidatus Heimdallarchaeota archaeon]